MQHLQTWITETTRVFFLFFLAFIWTNMLNPNTYVLVNIPQTFYLTQKVMKAVHWQKQPAEVFYEESCS